MAWPGDLRGVDRGARGEGELVRVAAEVYPEIEITEINRSLMPLGG